MAQLKRKSKALLAAETKANKIIEKLNKEQEELKARFEASVDNLKKIEDKEKELTDATRKLIDDECEKNEMFCGVILAKDDILTILDLHMTTGEPVSVPYAIYFKHEN
jgi:predicted nuclease with TOPRIM domain